MSRLATGLIVGRFLDVINDERLYGTLCRDQFQAKLFLDCGEDPGEIRIGVCGVVRGPFQLECVVAGQLRLVENHAVHDAGQEGSQVVHRRIAAEKLSSSRGDAGVVGGGSSLGPPLATTRR